MLLGKVGEKSGQTTLVIWLGVTFRSFGAEAVGAVEQLGVLGKAAQTTWNGKTKDPSGSFVVLRKRTGAPGERNGDHCRSTGGPYGLTPTHCNGSPLWRSD